MFVGVGVEAFEVRAIFEALLAEKEVVAVFTHPAMLQDFPFAAEALVALVLLHLRLKNHFQLVLWFVTPRQTRV